MLIAHLVAHLEFVKHLQLLSEVVELGLPLVLHLLILLGFLILSLQIYLEFIRFVLLAGFGRWWER